MNAEMMRQKLASWSRQDRGSRGGKGFTLLELLVVVSIILILLGIGAPAYYRAHNRALVAVAHTNLANLETALDWYWSDHGAYPATVPVVPSDPLALLANHQLAVLTSPVPYLGRESLLDPFGVVESQAEDANLTAGNDFPKLDQPNEDRSLLYFHYPSLSLRLRVPTFALRGACVLSIGPDRRDSLGVYRPFGRDLFEINFKPRGYATPLDTLYSPTNGIVSSGDIPCFVGEAKHFRVP